MNLIYNFYLCYEKVATGSYFIFQWQGSVKVIVDNDVLTPVFCIKLSYWTIWGTLNPRAWIFNLVATFHSMNVKNVYQAQDYCGAYGSYYSTPTVSRTTQGVVN